MTAWIGWFNKMHPKCLGQPCPLTQMTLLNSINYGHYSSLIVQLVSSDFGRKQLKGLKMGKTAGLALSKWK